MGAVGAALLSRLGLEGRNAGACAGSQAWRGGGPLLASINPSDESLLAEVVTATAADYDAVLAAAVAAARAWREVPAPRRGEAVRRLGVLLREHKDALGTLIALENGKIKAEGDGEVQEMIDIADLAVGQARMLYGKTMHSERPAHRMYEQWHPLGVVGVITAFNFPVAVWAWNALLAAVCGNATIWKPSPKTPLVAIGVQHLCNRVVAELDLPPIFTLLIDAGREAAARLATDPRVALLSFTGSSAVGRQIAQVVAGRFGRCLLECSGNNAIIVAADADLGLVIPAVVFGAAGTAGQRCTTTRRLLVHESIEAEVVRRLAAASRRTTSASIDSCTSSRRVVVQRWPAVPAAPKTTAGMTRPRSASAATMIALLPEHSSRQRPKRPATTCAICRPTADEPVNDTSATRGSAASRAAASRPGSMSSVNTGGRSSSAST